MRTYLRVLLLFLAVPAAAQTGVPTLRTSIDYRGPIVRGAVLSADEAVLATSAELYRVRGGRRIEAAARRPEPEAQLVLAPGGRFYAWLRAKGAPGRAVTRVSLHTLGSDPAVEFETESASGWADLLFGLDARLIMTRAPLGDPEGRIGPFRYTFWSSDGKALQSVTFDRANMIAATDGTAVLLLGPRATRAYASDGRQLWEIGGAFRKGAMSSANGPALLNPAERRAINQILLAGAGERRNTITLPTPVHHLAIAPDGRLAAAAGDRGRYFLLDPASGRMREGRAIPQRNGTPYIFDLEIAGPQTLLIGVLHRSERERRWPAASVFAVRTNGNVTFSNTVAVTQATANVPNIDVRYGDARFVAATREQVFFGRVDGGRD